MKKQAWIIAYDITDNKRLGRVYRFLKKEAIPIQRSIFYYEGTVSVLTKILDEIEGRINSKTDDVRAYCLPTKLHYYAIGASVFADGIELFSETNNEVSRLLGYNILG